MRLRALRGATCASENTAEDILAATEELLTAMIERNALSADAIVSCIFTVTADLDAEFPAVAARRLGLASVPLLCAREIEVPGAMDSVIRVLAHCYMPVERSPKHVYLGEAAALRRDLEAAQ